VRGSNRNRAQFTGVNVMANPSQSQDVEHQGPKFNPLDSRRRQSRRAFEDTVQDELDRAADPGQKQQEAIGSKLLPPESDTVGPSAGEMRRSR
jgi:hypothetical protein